MLDHFIYFNLCLNIDVFHFYFISYPEIYHINYNIVRYTICNDSLINELNNIGSVNFISISSIYNIINLKLHTTSSLFTRAMMITDRVC